MDKARVIDTLKQIIADDLDLNIARDQIDDAASFLEDGLALDSISMAEFINHLERRFPIRILDEDGNDTGRTVAWKRRRKAKGNAA